MVNKKNRPVKTYPIIGVCGLDCGLCPSDAAFGKTKAKILKNILNEIALKEGIELVKK
jgi:hypothetical protein